MFFLSFLSLHLAPKRIVAMQTDEFAKACLCREGDTHFVGVWREYSWREKTHAPIPIAPTRHESKDKRVTKLPKGDDRLWCGHHLDYIGEAPQSDTDRFTPFLFSQLINLRLLEFCFQAPVGMPSTHHSLNAHPMVFRTHSR